METIDTDEKHQVVEAGRRQAPQVLQVLLLVEAQLRENPGTFAVKELFAE